MTIQDYKILFSQISTYVVNHNPAHERSHFFMADSEDYNTIEATSLDFNTMCIYVSYPIETIRRVDGKYWKYTNFIFDISKIVAKEDFTKEAEALQEAIETGDKFLKYLYWIQKKHNGFRLKTGSFTRLDINTLMVKPIIYEDPDYHVGQQYSIDFLDEFDFCDAEIEANVKNNVLWN